jgi:FdhD protein
METEIFEHILRYRDGVFSSRPDELACEEPLEIRVRGRAISVTMRTPRHDDELAAGFLLTEGIIKRKADVLAVEPCSKNEDGNVLNVLLAADVAVNFESLTRHVFASSSCGLCGKATIESIRGKFASIDFASADSDACVDPAVLLELPKVMRQTQGAFDRSGGLHAAALFETNGRLLVIREDVGRHNAVDKVLGHALLHGLALDKSVLVVSGRSSFEIMQKALAGRVPVVAAVSAPSSLAVEFARNSGQTLIGFLREGRMNIYAHAERLRGAVVAENVNPTVGLKI